MDGQSTNLSEEVMVLRTKLLMAQQDAQRRSADIRGMTQHLQVLSLVSEHSELETLPMLDACSVLTLHATFHPVYLMLLCGQEKYIDVCGVLIVPGIVLVVLLHHERQ